MKIAGFSGSFRNFPFPTHPDFSLHDFNNKNSVIPDAYIQTSVVGVLKRQALYQYQYIANSGKPVLVMEQAVFRQNLHMYENQEEYYFRLGLNHYDYKNGYFANKNSPGDRWQQIQKDQEIEIKPWKSTGDYILILLQHPVDTSINSILRYMPYSKWIENLVKKIRDITDEDIVIRMHPVSTHKRSEYGVDNLLDYPNVYLSEHVVNNHNPSHGGSSLYDDFANARVCVGYTSNSLTEAVCEGIPTISLSDESFAYPVSYDNLEVLHKRKLVCKIDRTQWLHDCSYAQWKLSEINEGIPHRRLL